MTKIEIPRSELEQRLNELVTVHVFGECWHESFFYKGDHPFSCNKCDYLHKGFTQAPKRRSPSTDANDMIEMLEKANFHKVVMKKHYIYSVEIFKLVDGECFRYWSEHETNLNHAACIACLKANGFEVTIKAD